MTTTTPTSSASPGSSPTGGAGGSRIGVVLPSGGEMVTTPVGSVIVTHFETQGTRVAVFDTPTRAPAVTIVLPGDGTVTIELRDQPTTNLTP